MRSPGHALTLTLTLTLTLSLLSSLPAHAGGAAPKSFAVEVSGKGPPVILIPGLACNGSVWASTVARYRDRHEMHVLSLAGFGGQPALGDGNEPLLPTVRAELAAYIREHKLQKPIVVGHSLGGFLALWLAASEPDLLGGIVVVDSLPYLPAAMDPSATVEKIKPRAEAMRKFMAQTPPDRFAAQNRTSLGTMITDAQNADAVALTSKLSNPAAVATAMSELLTTDARPLLPSIKVPSLILVAGMPQGAEATGKLFESQYVGLPHHTLFVVEKARHFIFIDDPATFFAKLDGALARGAGK